MANKPLRIGYVPEHFSTPLHFAQQYFGLDATLIPFPSGTGHMITSLRSAEIDVGIGLTEGWIAGLGRRKDQVTGETLEAETGYSLVGTYVETPLCWAISTGVNRDDVESVHDLKGGKIGVSRLGSGSHIMGFVLADQHGWLSSGSAPFSLQPLQTFAKLREAVNDKTADFFMWEYFTTKKYYSLDASPSPVKQIGEIYTPWPSWHIVATDAEDSRLQDLFNKLDQGIGYFREHQDEAVQYISTALDYSEEDAKTWLGTVKFTQGTKGIDEQVLQKTIGILQKAGVLASSPDQGSSMIDNAASCSAKRAILRCCAKERCFKITYLSTVGQVPVAIDSGCQWTKHSFDHGRTGKLWEYSSFDEFAQEEDGYLPSDLNLDDFFRPRRGRWTRRLVMILSWIFCIILGTILGAGIYHLHTFFTTPPTSNTIATTTSSDFPSLSTTPDLRSSFLSSTSKWNYTHPPFSPCGSTPSTALSAGCKFGIMAYAWYPSQCYDSQLEAEFLAFKDWKWYSRPHFDSWHSTLEEGGSGFSRTSKGDLVPWRELPRNEVLAGTFDLVFIDSEYEERYCGFMERKVWRVLLGLTADGDTISRNGESLLFDNYVLRSGHQLDCMRKRWEHEQMPVTRVMKYFDCVRP